MPTYKLNWTPRAEPIAPIALAVASQDEVALIQTLLALEDERLARLKLAIGKPVSVLLGATEDLPWLPDAEWLGVDPQAPTLLLPTTYHPGVPTSLLASAVHRDAPFGQLVAPIAVLRKARCRACAGVARVADKSLLRNRLAAIGAAL